MHHFPLGTATLLLLMSGSANGFITKNKTGRRLPVLAKKGCTTHFHKHKKTVGASSPLKSTAEEAPSDTGEGVPYVGFVEDPFNDAIAEHMDAKVVNLIKDLKNIGDVTKRGFDATPKQRREAKNICEKLAEYNPTIEPAYPYYSDTNIEQEIKTFDTLEGKWTLLYTDAPDITSLKTGPFSSAKLGRIGQECQPPFIRNVIEWKRPDWASQLPFSGSDESRVLQKVCTEAQADPKEPLVVNLKLVGLDLLGFGGLDGGIQDEAARELDIPEGPGDYFEKNPVELKGPLKAPFGKFKILYLDPNLRIIKTQQGFITVSERNTDENAWF